ncbi:spore coat protein B [Niallia circulans]|jgi:spore coat protein B|uniref:Spore coat protein n=1 Tax=Niallia circulans TaxID=1397 RepID=A0A0J1IDC5_NIACI|nr:hypothetical protein [Niallia circulans]KLV23903.1 hypothetical protein ABW02_18880 [Niallia circulans]MCM2982112.1 hypothetical protein [Niallia circulans]MDR4317570.1 hypothetical protein [Niallia circulans]MED3840512.1 hypothetical protein [Niallia circulans]MED4243516.1 hypothetical protein [Niallia circulans]
MNVELLQTLVGKVVKIDRGGPNSKVGLLLAVGDDFLTILIENDGIVYYKLHHIKSITENAKKGLPFELVIPESFEYKEASTFAEILDSLEYYWVKINRGGKDSIEGVLEAINSDYVTVVSNEEIIRLSLFHIHNISYGAVVEKPEKEKEEKEEKQEEQKEEKID